MPTSGSSGSYLLTDLSWVEVRDHLARDRRLIVPVGACDQFGPHLPIGSGTLVAEAIAAELARDFGVLCAPALPYGVNVPGEHTFAGAASVREKSLHRLLNDLLSAWEGHGFEEFVLITAQVHDPHVEALATVATTHARVRVLEVLGLDFTPVLGERPEPQHGGEVMTSLMLYLRPDKVNLERAHDFAPQPLASGALPHSMPRLPSGSPGSVGYPSRASAETGRRLFEHIVQKIRTKVFVAPPEALD